MSNPFDIVKHALMTEKAMSVAEKANGIIFIVDKRANKNQIKQAVEKIYEVKVQSVNTQITLKGQKKAYVQLTPEFSADEIMTKAGVI